MPRYEKVLVTGGSGRVGAAVVDELMADYDVTVLDRNKPSQDVRFIAADIEDRASLEGAFDGIDAVVQLAALDMGVQAPEADFFRVNVQGLWNVLEFAETAKVKRTVVCSSLAAVNISRANPPRYLPVDIHHPAAPVHAYGISKLAGEVVAKAFSERSPMQVFCLRPMLVMRDAAIYGIARQAALEDGTPPPPAAADPEWAPSKPRPGSRHFVSTRDVARAFRSALEADVPGFDIFYVAAADTHSALPTMEVCRRQFGVTPEIRDRALYDADPRASIYDISRTQEILGWQPEERWPDLLARVIAGKSGA